MIHSFWCEGCQRDFDGPAHESSNRYGRWWVGKCPKGHKAIRYITDRHLDPYFYKSKKLRQMRQHFKKDLVQPGSNEYKWLYPKEWAKMEEAEEEALQKELAKKHDYDTLKKKYGHSSTEWSMWKAIWNAQRKLEDGTN